MPRKVEEFYPQKQGRPLTVPLTDFETGANLVTITLVSHEQEAIRVEALLKEKFGIQSEQLRALLNELIEMKLHLASISDANVEDNGES